jgi:hypothetical protein
MEKKKKRCREGTRRHLTESKPVEAAQSERENAAPERSRLNSKRDKTSVVKKMKKVKRQRVKRFLPVQLVYP